MPVAELITPTLFATYPSPLGPLRAQAVESGLLRLDFLNEKKRTTIPRQGLLATLGDELERYFAGEQFEFTTPLLPQGTDFQQQVWAMLREIPYGETWSYSELAEELGRPEARRAAAQANGRNPISILIPCHRVIGANGSLTGFNSGLERKRFLLDLEQGQQMLI